ncbi:MAG: PAS domain-containing hybrid sensor histidine kinase/response regulator, partial [Wenzhouxiangellaceae bacterium]|nr:PAS domain-containing hybrid sensor histidine kinase/response regulator [Wenzhouxiangellaceae bacterium]
RTARWLFPLFLILIGLPILPLARAGEALLGGRVPSDLYVLMLPLEQGHSALALFAFLGGLSAATGMVILASLTLSIMIGNHWLTPLMLNRRGGGASELGISVRMQRRAGIVLVVLMAYAYSRLAGTSEALADIGAMSFSGLAQLAPAVVLAVYRPGLEPRALLAGLSGGVAVWAYVLLLPMLVHPTATPGWLEYGPLGIGWLAPEQLLGLGGLEALSRAVLASLATNLALIGLVQRFGLRPGAETAAVPPIQPAVLRDLSERFLPPERSSMLFESQRAADDLEADVEHELAAVVGGASARLLLDAARRRAPAPLETVADLVGQASEQARFSREVLSGALENMSQGICVVDADMRLVAWNRPYLELFDYPAELIRVGRPVADLLRHNAEQGLMGRGDIDARIERRLAHKRAGTRHRIERPWPDGRMIEIRGNPMPGGGFVATFTDVTAFRAAEAELKQVNETLEQRVAARTAELERAKHSAERANNAKSRFLAAVSHDLVQPLNAAQLMTHSLARKLDGDEQRHAISQIAGALGATEDLLEGLLDISRLDAGGLEARITAFPLAELFDQLAGEFGALAGRKGLGFDAVRTSVWVESDPQLLRRVLQNFLSNAVRYTRTGRVVLGTRRRGSRVLIGVWDTGPGIPRASRRTIFEEFRRLDADRDAPGLGLGLAIAERIARLLRNELVLESRDGRGAMFGVEVPRTAPGAAAGAGRAGDASPAGGRVLLVDNDAQMLRSLAGLLADWNFKVDAVAGAGPALALDPDPPFDLLVVDYHLDERRTGLELLQDLRAAGHAAPALLISADHTAELRNAARAAGCELLHKPIRPLALRSMIRRLLGAISR